ncbi:MAG: pyruvate kinase [Clostridiales bacterium]|nr:pyruvate kinase [Clostridiales bacterium]
MKDFRKTKIIGTIGPASESEEMLTKLMKAGLNVCRINFSHGGFEENAVKIQTIKNVREKLGLPIALALDTKGPEIRTGKLESGDEKVVIHEGQEFTFVKDDIIGNETKTTISYKDLYKDVKPGTTILVDDGTLEFEVKEVVGTDIVTVAKNTAKLGSRKTMNIRGVKVNLPALAQKDIDDITNGVKAGFDYIFASFVRRADDVRQIRKLLNDNGGQEIEIISKIESQEGVDNMDEIIELSDGIMVARGDMGVEIPLENVPIVQKQLIKKCNEAGKPVIVATQMLESMQSNPRPTRAETSDVANAIYDLTSCIMLSGECAMGKYPVECVEVMNKIALAIESDLNYTKRFDCTRFDHDIVEDPRHQAAYNAVETILNSNADAVACYTRSGRSAEYLSSMRTEVPVLIITDNEKTYNKMSLIQGVQVVLVDTKNAVNDMIEDGILKFESNGILEKGDKVVIAGVDSELGNTRKYAAFSGVINI